MAQNSKQNIIQKLKTLFFHGILIVSRIQSFIYFIIIVVVQKSGGDAGLRDHTDRVLRIQILITDERRCRRAVFTATFTFLENDMRA